MAHQRSKATTFTSVTPRPPTFVGALVDKLGGEASIFLKNGNQYVRVATTMKKEDGTSAIGTALAADSSALPKLDAGQAYYGDATIFGETYNAGYEPIKDASGAVVGAYFVGFPK